METQSFQDRYGDELEITVYDNVVEFECYANGEHASLEFELEDAAEISQFISPEVAPAQAPINPTSTVPRSGNSQHDWNLIAAMGAKLLDLGLDFRYAKSQTAPIEHRTLTRVTDVVQSEEGHWLVIGHSAERDDARSFRIDRMASYASIA